VYVELDSSRVRNMRGSSAFNGAGEDRAVGVSSVGYGTGSGLYRLRPFALPQSCAAR